MLVLNDPKTLAAVTEAFEAYEAPLLANDVPVLQSFFWKSPESIRFGVTEQLYGYDAIAAFRSDRVVNFTARKHLRRSISTFGCDFASVMLEFRSTIGNVEREGRQSQTWARIDGQWKVAAAHVSLAHDAPPSDLALVRGNLAAQGLSPNPEWLPRIAANFATTAALASGLMAFSLPETTEPAPVFAP